MRRLLALGRCFRRRPRSTALILFVLLPLLVASPALATDPVYPRNYQDALIYGNSQVNSGTGASDQLSHTSCVDETTGTRINATCNASGHLIVTTVPASIRVSAQMDLTAVSTAIPASPLSGRTVLCLSNAGAAAFTAMGTVIAVCDITDAAAVTTGGIVLIASPVPQCIDLQPDAVVNCISASGTVRIAYNEGK
jgi:hypothetical protein